MIARLRLNTFALVLLGMMAGTGTAAAEPADCFAIFDAGSSGTRLYVYENRGGDWIKHDGLKTAALADPVRDNRNAKWAGGEGGRKVAAQIADTLATFMEKGPVKPPANRPWQGFANTCKLRSVNVYATAGMRLAEQKHPDRSRQLWAMLSADLSKVAGPEAQVRTKTLSGFEEGLFAWLAVHDARKTITAAGRDGFGIVEMGGASAQIAFPCESCADALPVRIDGRTFKMFSYSFLGAGASEAYKLFSRKWPKSGPTACDVAIGKTNPQWQPRTCSDTFGYASGAGIRDYFNYGANGRLGTVVRLPDAVSAVAKWYATGAFQHLKRGGVTEACVTGIDVAKDYNGTKACFINVYLRDFMRKVGVRAYTPSKADWTLGAVICDRENCLAGSPRPQCLWLEKGCLEAAN